MPPPVPTGGLPSLGQIAGLLHLAASERWGGEHLAGSLAPFKPFVLALERATALPFEARWLVEVIEGRRTPDPGRFAQVAERFAALGESVTVDEALLGRLHAITAGVTPLLVTGPLRTDALGAVQVLPEGMEDQTICPHCHLANKREFKFCEGCGTALIKDSPLVLAKFCHECGQPLPTQFTRLGRENRLMTMIFTDLEGFSNFAEYMHPDLLYPLVEEVLAGLASAVTSEGGYIPGYWGDAVFAIFGAPEAHEDDAVRAVRTALKMQEFMRSWNDRQRAMDQPTLNLRVGINTGRASWGLLRTPGRTFYTAFGNEVNKAARMEPKAPPGGIAATVATLERCRGMFVASDVMQVSVKNIRQPVQYVFIHREKPADDLLTSRGERIRLVGRTEELDALRQDYAEVNRGQGARLHLLVGEGGYGKSRLGAEFVEGLRQSGDDVGFFAATGENVEVRTPFKGIAGAIRRWARIPPNEPPEAARARLRAMLEETLPVKPEELEVHLHLLGNLLDLPFEDPPAHVQYLLNNASLLRDKTRESVVTLFDHLTRRRTVVLLLEDLHWIDRGTLRHVQEILEKLKNRPLFVLGLTRPRFADEAPPLLKGDYPVKRIDLTRLPRNLAEEMVREILREKTLSPADLEFVLTQADGNPFLLQEMAEALREEWKIEQETTTGERHFVSPGGARVPPGATGFLQERIDVLPDKAKEVLKAAAVIGQEFTGEDLVGLEKIDFEEILADLVRRKAVVDLGGGRYQFVHALLRDSVIQWMDQKDRRVLHRGRAWDLVRRRPDDPAIIAYHLDRNQGDEPENSADYYVKAAEIAFKKKGASTTAVEFYEKALALTARSDLKIQICLDRANLFYFSREIDPKYERTLQVLQDAEALLPADRSHVPRTTLALLHFYRGRACNRIGQYDSALTELQAGLALYPTDEIDVPRFQLQNELGSVYFYKRDHLKAGESHAKALEFARTLGNQELIGIALGNKALDANAIGRYTEAVAASEEAAELLSAANNLRVFLMARNMGVDALLGIGDYESALTILDGAIKFSKERAEGFYRGMLILNRGAALRLMGRSEDAFSDLQEAVDLYASGPDAPNKVVSYLYLSMALKDGQKWEEAREKASVALRIATKLEDPTLKARAQVALAEICLGEGKIEEAFRVSQEAVANLRAVGFVGESHLEILHTHAQILHRLGRNKEALDFLNEARAKLLDRAGEISDKRHRDLFLNRVTVNREIETRRLLLADLVDREVNLPEQAFLLDLSHELYVPTTLRPEVAFIEDETFGETVHVEGTPVKVWRRNGDRLAGVVINETPILIVSRLFSGEVEVERNPGPYREEVGGVDRSIIEGRNVRLRLSVDENKNPTGTVRFNLGSQLYESFLAALHAMGVLPEAFDIHLQGRKLSDGGGVSIELETGVKRSRLSEGVLGEDLFGKITFHIIPRREGGTFVSLIFKVRDFTTYPENFIPAIAKLATSGPHKI